MSPIGDVSRWGIALTGKYTNSIIIKNNTKSDTQAQGGRERAGIAGEGRSPGARSAPLRTQSAEAARRAAGLRPVPGFFCRFTEENLSRGGEIQRIPAQLQHQRLFGLTVLISGDGNGGGAGFIFGGDGINGGIVVAFLQGVAGRPALV